MELRMSKSDFEGASISFSQRLPLIIQAPSTNRDLAELVDQHKDELNRTLLDTGVILFRGFDVWGTKHFGKVITALGSQRMEYLYRSTPRTTLGERIYTATEYPASQEIPLHNENSYQRQWPLKIVLCCLRPAQSGGETPIADMRNVTALIPPALLDKFEEREVRYVRHYRAHTDISWQTVFQANDPESVDRFCNSHGIDCDWLDGETMRTTQVCQGVARHPTTGERFFFNQAHLFHSSSLGPEAESALIGQYGHDRLPRQAHFGDGGQIKPEELELIRNAYSANAITFRWEAGDFLLVDNMQFAHGRRSYSGKRQVLAALLDPNKSANDGPRLGATGTDRNAV
jgi:alpha-ketoglutarate-dependent taurine dioxygenase